MPDRPIPITSHRCVSARARHQTITFLDAFRGYHQIEMQSDDKEKTAFITERGVYCCKVMSFRLKTAEVTYQRLVNMMSKDFIGVTMEVYINDMLVKSLKTTYHVQHLTKTFHMLREYQMKFNPNKMHFWSININVFGLLSDRKENTCKPITDFKAIWDLESPKSMKDIQRLTGCFMTY